MMNSDFFLTFPLQCLTWYSSIVDEIFLSFIQARILMKSEIDRQCWQAINRRYTSVANQQCFLLFIFFSSNSHTAVLCFFFCL